MQTIRRRTVAVTGGTGFIGRKLVDRHLAAGDSVRVLTRRSGHVSLEGCDLHHGDLTVDSGALREFVEGTDILYHCAGELRDPSRMEALHVGGTSRLLGATTGWGGRWVQLSSVGVYGPHRTGTITEQSRLNPVGIYELTKAHADELVTGVENLSHTILRPSIVFGGDMPNRSLGQMVFLISKGFFFFVGKPGASANYIHVDNVVDALLLCATSPNAAGQIHNLSDWRTMESFVCTIARELGRPAPARRLPDKPVRFAARTLARIPAVPLSEARVDALTNRSTYPTDRIVSDLGYSPGTSMEEGLHEFVSQWRKDRGR